MLQILIATGLIPSLVKGAIDVVTSAINPAPAPVAPAKVPSAGVTVNPASNLATHILTAIGAGLVAVGATQAHGIYDAIINAPVIGGLLVSGLSMLISHFSVGGSNDNTLDILDKVIVALTPTHPSATFVSPGPADAAPPASPANPTPAAA